MTTGDEVRAARRTEVETALAQALIDEFGAEAPELCRQGAADSAARGDEMGNHLRDIWLRWSEYAEKILANA